MSTIIVLNQMDDDFTINQSLIYQKCGVGQNKKYIFILTK